MTKKEEISKILKEVESMCHEAINIAPEVLAKTNPFVLVAEALTAYTMMYLSATKDNKQVESKREEQKPEVETSDKVLPFQKKTTTFH